jgi:hypothetical protein
MRACAGAGLVEAIRRVAAGEDLLDHARTDRLKER